MTVIIPPENLDEIFDNQYILSQNEFTSEEVNALIDSLRWEIRCFVDSKIEELLSADLQKWLKKEIMPSLMKR